MAAGFGAFGKVPALGDFFRLNLGQGFVAAWDAWLQATMTAAQARLGTDWEDRYMSAPIWRFALAAGQAGVSAMVGVMMPSVDRVGRKFPLTLACPVPEEAPLRLLALQDAVLTRLEDLALDALDDDMTQDRLAAALATLAPLPPLAPSGVRQAAGGYVVTAGAAEALLPDLALALGPAAPVVFSTAVEGAARLIAGPALPEGAGLAAGLFDLSAPYWSEAPP